MTKIARKLSKTSRPVTRGLLRRSHLLARIDEFIAEAGLIWVSAPAGSGKTSLISSYLEKQEEPSLWYQLDGGDNDPATFFYYLGLASPELGGRCPSSLPVFAPEHFLGLAEFSQAFFSEFLGAGGTRHFLVLDNFQEIRADSPLQAVIHTLAGLLGPETTLVIISRTAPPAHLSAAQTGRAMAFLDWQDLRLSYDEFRELTGRRWTATDEQAFLPGMYERLDGWMTGVQLFCESREAPGLLPEDIEGYNARDFFAYFGEEVLQKLPEKFQDFLVQTSFLPFVSADLAHKITGNGRALQVLTHLHDNNFFINKREGEPAIFQYHQLFQDFLKKRAAAILSSQDLAALKKKTAHALMAAEIPEAALPLLAEMENWQEVAGFVDQFAPILIDQNRHQTVQTWFAVIPPKVLEEQPWLAYWYGMSQLPFQPAQARAIFQKGYGVFQDSQKQRGLLLCWSQIVLSYFLEWNTFRGLDRWLDEGEKLAAELPEDPEIAGQFSIFLFIGLLLRRPQHPMLAALEQGLQGIIYSELPVEVKLLVGHALLLYYTLMGESAKADLLFNPLLNSLEKSQAGPALRLTGKIIEIYHHWFGSDFARQQEVVEQGLGLAEQHGIHFLDFKFYSIGSYGAIARQDLATAASFQKKMTTVLDTTKSMDVAHYHYLISWQALVRHDTELALAHGKKFIQEIDKGGSPFFMALDYIAYGHVLFAHGRCDEARDYLDKAVRIQQETGSHLLDYKISLARASFAFAEEREEEGQRSLHKMLTVGAAKKIYVIDWWLPEVMRLLCEKALQAGDQQGYVQELIRRNELTPSASLALSEQWPWPLKIYCLGGFAIRKDDVVLGSSGKAQQKPLDLLKVLIAHGGRNVAKALVADALWPDADGDLQDKSLTTTLHRLRKLLGQKDAVVLQEGLLHINHTLCWCDTVAFSTLVDNALRGDADGEQAFVSLTRALALYKGFFLAKDQEEYWSIATREQLHARFMKAVHFLGAVQEEQQQWQQAVELYEHSLVIDPLLEESYLGLMRCHRALGHPAEAVKIFQRCQKIYHHQLGIAPSAPLQALYADLTTTLSG